MERFKVGDVVALKKYNFKEPYERKVSEVYEEKNHQRLRFGNLENFIDSRLFKKVSVFDIAHHNKIKRSITDIGFSKSKDQHISSHSGKPKVGFEDFNMVLQSAYKMSEKKGGEWVVYECNVCNLYHVGRHVEEKVEEVIEPTFENGEMLICWNEDKEITTKGRFIGMNPDKTSEFKYFVQMLDFTHDTRVFTNAVSEKNVITREEAEKRLGVLIIG